MATLQIASEPSSPTKYLINTTKILRGHKIKTSDFLKLQLLKNKHANTPYQLLPTQQVSIKANFNHQHDKFKAFNTLQSTDINRQIVQQRQQHSSLTRKRLKIFNTNIRNISRNSEQEKFQLIRPANTSQDQRMSKMSHIITLAQSTPISSKAKTVNLRTITTNKKRIKFTSQNLGQKMIAFMNQVVIDNQFIEDEEKNQQNVILSETQKNTQQQAKDAYRQPRPITNSYCRQMKKLRRQKLQVPKEISTDFTNGFNLNISNLSNKNKQINGVDKLFTSLELRNGPTQSKYYDKEHSNQTFERFKPLAMSWFMDSQKK